MSVFTDLPEIKQRTYAVNELAFAVLTHMPITPGHTLIIPKREVATFAELNSDELLAIHQLAEEVMSRLRDTVGAEGFNCAWNQGEQFGQSVPHFHLHVVPRTEGDTGINEYEPRKYLYRPGERDKIDEKELQDFATKLKEAL